MKALAMVSGGLDSILAAKLVQDLGIEVEILHLVIPFHQSPGDASGYAERIAARLGMKLHIRELGDGLLRVIENPKYNYGKAMNPCVDCRIYQLIIAKDVMKEIGASFIITGEVLDQRPHSQRRDAMDIVERDADLRGYLLRPLSARHMRPTIPEEQGWVDRNELLDFKGRGRRQQMDLAASYGIDDYPRPGGGCLLTYQEYGEKISDLLSHDGGLTLPAVHLLRLGRHLRLSPEVKIIVGKNDAENNEILKAAGPADTILEVADHDGPTTLYLGPEKEELLKLAAGITAGFAGLPPENEVNVNIINGTNQRVVSVKPVPKQSSRQYFIYRVD